MQSKRMLPAASRLFIGLAFAFLALVAAPASAQVAYDFCPAAQSPIFSIVNGVQIWRHDPGATTDTHVTDLNAPPLGDVNGLMIDPVRNRLLFLSRVNTTQTQIWAYDAANGGWYAAAPPFTSNDLPRAGMAPSGVGYLIAGNNTTPQVWAVIPDPTPGSFGYTVESRGNLSYNIAPTNTSSGDIAFDAQGVGWLSAGQDLYSVDLEGGSTAAVREARPLLNGSPSTIQWAGVAFSDDGKLYVANNSAPSAYYSYNPVTGELTQEALTGFGGSRDLASCAFPTLPEPELSVVKSLAQVNGVAYVAGTPVGAGDVLQYAITISNAGGAAGTLFPNDVTDTLPTNTTRVAAGNDFTCVGATCRNAATVNVPAGGNTILDFIVQVNNPLPPGATTISNAVTVAGLDCADPGNDCSESTPVGPAVSVSKTSDVAAGSIVSPGQMLTYTVSATVTNAATVAPVTLTDTLGAGLTFGSVTVAGPFNCSGALTCTLPTGAAPGVYSVSYTATVDADAAASVSNGVTTDVGNCVSCQITHPVSTAITVAKSSTPASGSSVLPGDGIAYSLSVTVANSATTQVLTLTDALGAGLSFGSVTAPGPFACAGSLSCTLPAGTAPGTYVLGYTATVDADATGTLANVVTASNPPGGDPDPTCATCSTQHEVTPASITVAKSSTPASGSSVLPGDSIAYALSVTVATSATTQVLTLTDALGAGLSFGSVTTPGPFACAGSLSCTLPAGTAPGTYVLGYTATVDADATGTLANVVTASNPPGGDPDPTCTTCSTEHEVTPASITVAKSSTPASGSSVLPGDGIAYSLSVTVANSATTQVLTLTDALGAGLSFGSVTAPGPFACAGSLSCTLPAGTAPGTYVLGYTATVDADATGTLANVVTASNPPGGDPDPTCTTCSTEHEVTPASITVAKSSTPASGSSVLPGDGIAYSLSVTVANSATTQVLTLTDALGAGLSFGSVTAPGPFACAGSLSCTLPAGTAPGTYVLGYTATVDADATGTLANVVTASNPPGGDPDPTCTTCSTQHEVTPATVRISKRSNPGDGAEVRVGQTIAYTLTATVENSVTLAGVRLVDTPGAGLTIGALPPGCAWTGASITCELPAGLAPGTYDFNYEAVVNADAAADVGNVVLGSMVGGETLPPPQCDDCATTHELADQPALRVTKEVGTRNARTGDLIRYTVTVENVGAVNITGGTVVDTPPTGFSYVEGSMSVADRDGSFTLAPGQSPLSIGGVDVNAGERATIVYLLRVGAGVRGGTHVNQAVAVDPAGTAISNVATAQVVLDSDPLLDDSLIFGTVWHDRDEDGWQDAATLTNLQVRGGFSPDAYIAGTTMVERGGVTSPLADRSAPLLRGLDLGSLAGRRSDRDTAGRQQIVIRQRLSRPEFTDDFLLTTAEGFTLRMTAAGAVAVHKRGDAARGLTSADLRVERRIEPVENGYLATWTIRNEGVDEAGLPGVRIASVEGVLVATDQFGRYHLIDVPGGPRAHGRNFILKVDPATLPTGARMTSDNPLVRRITPGLPVRFDFGVQLPRADGADNDGGGSVASTAPMRGE